MTNTKRIVSIDIIKPGSNPDVDSDINTEYRDRTLEHVTEIYGKDNVANIVTFNTLAAKGAFKEMCTIYNIPFSASNKIAALIPPPIEGVECTIDDIFNPKSDRYAEGADFRTATAEEYWQKIIEGAREIEGRNKSTGVHPCFTAGTLIKTSEGLVPIEDITVGQLVLTHTNSYQPVLDLLSRESADTFFLKAANSIPTITTDNHPFFVRSIEHHNSSRRTLTAPRWEEAGNLIVGKDLIGTPVNNKSDLPTSYSALPIENPDFWWIVGRFLGDGWVEDFVSNRNCKKKDGTPYIYSRDEKRIKIAVGYEDPSKEVFVSKLSSLFSYSKQNYRTSEKYQIKYDPVLFDFLKEFGKYAPNKIVPDFVQDLPVELLTHFLDGYLSADGSYQKESDSYFFSSVSPKLILGMTAVVNKVYKAHCSISVEKRSSMIIEGRTVNCHDKYSVRFAKESRVKDKSFYLDGYIWAKVQKVVPTGQKEDVYNLSVDNDNSYIANGLIAHNCGIVISSKPLDTVIPLHVRESDNRVITQWRYEECESLGLIKMDFLGLDTVDLIQHTVEYIQKSGKKAPNMIEIIHGDMKDKKTLDLVGRGDTIGVFQLASPGVQDLLKRIKPTSVDDIIATTALYRPGPMGMQSHIKYADRKNNREPVTPIHKDFVGSPLDKILEKTWNLVVYQEQILQISNQIAGMTLQEGDDLRKAMGKKIVEKMMKMKPKFIEGGKKNGYSEEAMNILWDTISEFAKYGFNKCAHGDTIIYDEFGRKIRLRDLNKRWVSGERDIKILSMWEDGEIRPHKIRNVTYTGKKPVYTIKTASGKSIKITKEHRLLTNNGYGSIEDGGLTIGSELMVDENTRDFSMSDSERQRRKDRLTSYNKSEKGRKKASDTMKLTQSRYGFEERSAWQKEIQKNNPERTNPWLEAGRKKLAELRNDPIWVQKFAEALVKREREGYRGYGKVTQISDGRYCDSISEAAAAEYLISRGIEFELHKSIPNPKTGIVRISDFYANGIYFEMDGLSRGEQWFKDNKYGDVPFVYLNPYNFIDKIDEAFATLHVENGDPIVEIIEPEGLPKKVYDIEMELEGPSNFIANGIVSHNSHSVAYGINAYQAAYLKANYPVEFMAALIAQNIGSKDKILSFLQEARRMGLKVGSVEINTSEVKVSPDYSGNSGFDIVYGLGGINAVSNDMAQIIVTERKKNGPYKSVQDLINRCTPLGINNKKIYENLALAGAFDNMGVSRKAVVENLSVIMNQSKAKEAKGSDLFDMFGMSETTESASIKLEGLPEYPFVEKLKQEANVIGLYLTDHPLSKAGPGLSKMRNITIQNLLKSKETVNVYIAGSVTEIISKTRRAGGKSMMITIDDGTGYLSANLSRDIVKGIDKFVAQEKIKNMYISGADGVPEELEEIATSEFKPIQTLEKNSVYIINLTFRPSFDETPYGARVNSIRPLVLADNGMLPVRIRYHKVVGNEDHINRVKGALPRTLHNKLPGEYPIFTAEYDSLSLSQDDIYYVHAISEMKGLKGSSEEKKVWPPEGVKVSYSEPESILEKAEAIELLHYVDSGYTTDKNGKVEQAIEKFLGVESYDFGVFDPSILE